MNLNEIKDLMAQFDQSSLREFSYKNGTDELQFSKNEARMTSETPAQVAPAPTAVAASPVVSAPSTPVKSAVEEAEISPEQVAYVNAHGTSTPANEKGESGAIVAVLGKEVPVSSTKSFTGHLLGAAGAVEAIATIEAMRHNYVPMTAGTSELSDYIEANVVYGQGLEQEIPYAISNTFGFGGHNAVLAFKRWENK